MTLLDRCVTTASSCAASLAPSVTCLCVCQLVNSVSGPSSTLAEALWHADDTNDQVELLWHDGNLAAWECKTAYRWELEHRPDIGVIRCAPRSVVKSCRSLAFQ